MYIHECKPICHLDYDTLYTLIRALILSRLDYCNSLFADSPQSTLHRLQRVQDAAARLLCGASARTLLDSSVVLLPGRMHHLS